MSDTDWRISSLLHQVAESFDKQAKAAEGIIQTAQRKFERDYTGTTAGVGIVIIAASVYLAMFGKSEVFSTAGLVTGAIILICALIMRHKSAESQIRNSEKLFTLEQERARFAQRSFVAQQVWMHGLPEGTPLAQLQILLGDAPTLPRDSDAGQLTWKPLPPQQSSNATHTAQ